MVALRSPAPERRALREHVIELAWQVNNRAHHPGDFVGCDAGLMTAVFGREVL